MTNSKRNRLSWTEIETRIHPLGGEQFSRWSRNQRRGLLERDAKQVPLSLCCSRKLLEMLTGAGVHADRSLDRVRRNYSLSRSPFRRETREQLVRFFSDYETKSFSGSDKLPFIRSCRAAVDV